MSNVWERESLEPRYLGDGPGTRLRLLDPEEKTLATIVHYPSTTWRLYFPDGKILDRPTEAEAVALAEMMVLSRSRS